MVRIAVEFISRRLRLKRCISSYLRRRRMTTSDKYEIDDKVTTFYKIIKLVSFSNLFNVLYLLSYRLND